MKGHKCEGCPFRGEHQEPGFRPFGVCTREKNLIEAEKAYKAETCWLENKGKSEEKMTTHNMPDRANMENWIKHCAEMHLCAGCPYTSYAECTNKLLTDLWRYIRKLEKKECSHNEGI